MSGGPVDPTAAQAVADQRLQTVARGIQGQVDRRVRRVERSSAGLRQVTVASRDPATLKCEVYLDGDTTVPVPCGLAGSLVPIVGQKGWAIANGTDLLLVAMAAGVELPKCEIRTSRTNQTVGSGLTVVQFDAADGGAVRWDTDFDGTNSMADLTADRIYARWPGKYRVNANVRISNKSTAGADVVEIVQDQTKALARSEVNTNQVFHGHVSDEVLLTAGQFVEVWAQSTGSDATLGYCCDDTNGVRSELALTYCP